MRQLISWFLQKMSALKRMTVDCLVPAFTLILCGAVTVAWLTASPSARIQASNAEDLEETYPYWVWDPATSTLAMSKTQPQYSYLNNSNYPSIYNPNTQSSVKIGAQYYYFIGSSGDTIILKYIADIGQWEVQLAYQTSTMTLLNILIGFQSTEDWSNTTKKTVYTNGTSITGYAYGFTTSSTMPTLPEILLGDDAIQKVVNNALNATTNVTTQAITLNNNINNTYELYKNGGISDADFNTAMTMYREQLEDLAETPGATLSDQMAVNNALTNLDITVNQQVNNVNPDLLSLLNDYRKTLNTIKTNYNYKSIDQKTAMNQLNELTYTVNTIMAVGGYTSTADINAINAFQDSINNTIELIANYSDLDSTTAESAMQSDEKEIELLNDMISQMQDMETDSIMQNQQVQQNLSEVSNWLEPLWENIFIVGLIGTTALLVPIAVILDMRYKGL